MTTQLQLINIIIIIIIIIICDTMVKNTGYSLISRGEKRSWSHVICDLTVKAVKEL